MLCAYFAYLCKNSTQNIFNMRKVTLFLAVAVMALTTACKKQENPTQNDAVQGIEAGQSYHDTYEAEEAYCPMDFEEIDPAIIAFVEAYFPEVTIELAQQACHGVKVTLSDGTAICFNEELEWNKVSCVESTVYTVVPSVLVPEQIAAYVAENCEGQNIVEIVRKADWWRIMLDDETCVKFDTEFNVIEGGCNGGGHGNGGGCNGGGNGNGNGNGGGHGGNGHGGHGGGC